MTSTVPRLRLNCPRVTLTTVPKPSRLVLAVIASRVLVLLAGVVAAATVPRVAGWQGFDPTAISTHLGAAGNSLGASVVRWDSIHYLWISQHGYVHPDDTVFFPLYPALTALVGGVVGSDVWGGALISQACFGVALFLLYRLTEVQLGSRAATTTVLLLAFAPLSFFFGAVYTESLFLALSLGAVYAAHRERWLLASGLTALATLSRVPGIIVLLPVAWLLLRSPSRSWARAVSLLAAPAALIGFLGYMAARGFGFMAPLHNQLGAEHAHELTGPFVTLGFAVSAAWRGLRATLHGAPVFSPTFIGPFPPGFESVILLAVLLLAVAVLVLAFRRLPNVYGVYGLVTLIVCIFGPVVDQPLQGLDRYTLTIFPLWMAAGAWLAEQPLRWPVIGLGAGLLFFYSFEFATWAFVG